MGKTKVFLKYWHVDKLNELLERVHKAATVLQSCTYLIMCSQAIFWGREGMVTSIVAAATLPKATQMVKTAVTHPDYI